MPVLHSRPEVVQHCDHVLLCLETDDVEMQLSLTANNSDTTRFRCSCHLNPAAKVSVTGTTRHLSYGRCPAAPQIDLTQVGR